MATDKERADVMRELAAEHTCLTPRELANRADELDPPKPVYPDGRYAWVTYTHQLDISGNAYRALAQYEAGSGEWVMERTHTGASCTVVADNVTKVEPLRVLADDEISIKRPGYMSLNAVVALDDLGWATSADVLKDVRNALDAEAGDQS